MFYRNKNVLVTGAAGLVGQEVVRRLLEEGARVRATVFRERKLDTKHPNLEIVPCDLRDAPACGRIVQDQEIVLHLAAHSRGVQAHQGGQLEPIVKNLMPFVTVLEASARAGVGRFGWISSSTVYPDTEGPFQEESAFKGEPPDKYYGIAWAYRYCETLGNFVHRTTKTRFALVRTAAVYGPHERFSLTDGHVLPALMMKAVARKDPFPVWGDGQDVRDFVHVSDLARGFLSVVQRHPEADPVNVATGIGSSISVALRLILEAEGYKPTIEFQTDRPSLNKERVLSIEKAKKLIGYEPRMSLEQGLAQTLSWYKSQLVKQA